MIARMTSQSGPLPLMFWIRLVLGAALIGVLAFFGLFIFFAGLIAVLAFILVWQVRSWFQPRRAEPYRNMDYPDAPPGSPPPIDGDYKVIDDSRVEIIPPPRRPGQGSGPESGRN